MLCGTCYAWPCPTEPNLKGSVVFFYFVVQCRKNTASSSPSFVHSWSRAQQNRNWNSGGSWRKGCLAVTWESIFSTLAMMVRNNPFLSSSSIGNLTSGWSQLGKGTSREMCNKNRWLKEKLRLTLMRSIVVRRGSAEDGWNYWIWVLNLLKSSNKY